MVFISSSNQNICFSNRAVYVMQIIELFEGNEDYIFISQ